MPASDSQTQPILIFSLARSGSTLLRYVMDTHPRVWAPPELHLGALAESLYRTVASANASGTYDISLSHLEANPQVVSKVGSEIERLMGEHLSSRGKTTWCEKTPENLAHRFLLARALPRARFIVLYRHPLDVVYSCLELARFGFIPGVRRYVAQDPGNTVGALIRYWIEGTRDLLEIEEQYSERSFRLRYEDLVAAPEPHVRSLLEFLGLDWQPDLIHRVFATEHEVGLGDDSIAFSTKIHQKGLGRGRELPVERLTPADRRQLELLLPLLGYDFWPREGNPQGSKEESQPADFRGFLPQHYFETALPRVLADVAVPEELRGLTYELRVRGNLGGVWSVESANGRLMVRTGSARVSSKCCVELEASTLQALAIENASAIPLVRAGQIRLSGDVSSGSLRGLTILFRALSSSLGQVAQG